MSVAAVSMQQQQFLLLVKDGTPIEIAAYEVGWSNRELERQLDDASFAEMVLGMEGLRDASIEQVLYEKAKQGNNWAVIEWLRNRRSDRWKDKSQIAVTHSSELPKELVAATAAAVRESVIAMARQGAIAQLQAAPMVDIVDAEVIEDSADSRTS